MIFTNAYIFTFTKPFTLNATELSEFISTLKFTPLMSTEFSHFGFVSPIKGGLNLAHEANGNLLVCARKEEKLLPTPYVKELVEERIQELELTQPFSATKAQRAEIKEGIELELLPRAFTRKTDTYAYINAENNTIVINTSSRGKAEDVLSLLRKAIGTLPVTHVKPQLAVGATITDWVLDLHVLEPLRGRLGNNFSFGLEAHIISMGDDISTAVVKNYQMDSKEVEVHLSDFDISYITKLALNYEDTISFMLHDDLSIKRIKFKGIFEDSYNDDIEKFDAEFILMAGELNNMITDLHSEFGVSATDSLEA